MSQLTVASACAPFRELDLDLDGPVARVAFVHAERRNPLSTQLCEELDAALRSLANSQARVLILDGDEAFCSGEEIEELADPAAARQLFAAERQLVETLLELEQLTIAAVDGYALGGGLELTLACDFTVASRRTLWGLPQIDVAAGAGWDAAARIAGLIGSRRAIEISLIGALQPARRAVELGLWNRVVEDELLSDEVDALVEVLLAKEPRAAAELKLLLASSGPATGARGRDFVPSGPPADLLDLADLGGIGVASIACEVEQVNAPRGVLPRDFWI